MQEQAALDEVEMAAEEVAMEEPEGEGVLGEAQALYGKDEKDLMESEQADLAEQRKRWAAQEEEEAQIDQDAQLQAQLQAEEQARVACPAKKRATPYTEKQLEAARQAFPLDTEPASDDDEQQRSLLLARK